MELNLYKLWRQPFLTISYDHRLHLSRPQFFLNLLSFLRSWYLGHSSISCTCLSRRCSSSDQCRPGLCWSRQSFRESWGIRDSNEPDRFIWVFIRHPHHSSVWYCIDIVRRNFVQGTLRVNVEFDSQKTYQVKLDCPHVICFGDTLCAKQLNNNSCKSLGVGAL